MFYTRIIKNNDLNIHVANKSAVRDNPRVQAVIHELTEKLSSSGRILLRESGTEPVVRIMAEAADERTAEACVNSIIKAIKDEGLA